jgi:hypothetical protein
MEPPPFTALANAPSSVSEGGSYKSLALSVTANPPIFLTLPFFGCKEGPYIPSLSFPEEGGAAMSLKGKHALITGGSRGIGRGIGLKLAESGVKIAIHYYKNVDAANDTLAKVRE